METLTRFLLVRAGGLVLATGLAALAASGAPLTPSEEQDWRSRVRLALFAAGPVPPLAPETHSRFEPAEGVIAERVTYGTQFAMRVPAILYLPKAHAGKIPGLIVVNGRSGDKYSWRSFYAGILYARAGAAVLTYDSPGEGERNVNRQSGTRAHDQVEPSRELAQRLGGLMVTDVTQAVSYLAQRPEVDVRRLAALGHSRGSFVVSVTCALERRLKACVLSGGGNLDEGGGYWDHSEPFFKDLLQRVVELRGTPERVFETESAPGAGHRPSLVTRPVALWLERQLDFPNWTEQSIRAMEETRIGEWARANGVDMDPLYASEEREGGTPALGRGIPALSRSELSVLSAGEWERRRNQLVHETWLKEAKACIRREADPLQGLRKPHPRLVVTDDDLERIRALAREDPLAQRICERVRAKARALVAAPPARYELRNGRLLHISRQTVERIYTLALLYRLEGERSFLDRATAELRAVARFPNWHDNFLDKAEMTHAVAIGYDWLWPGLGPEDRALLRQALVEKGLRDSLPIYQEQRWWAVNRFNWNPVCNGGMGLGALAVAEDEPGLARAVLRRVVRSLPLALASYAPDGGWAEGPEYWHYATRYAVHLLAGLASALGHDFGLAASDGFALAGRFPVYATGPSGKLYNFADAQETPESTPEMFWLAGRFGQPVFAWRQRRRLENPDQASALDLIWYAPEQASPARAQWPLNICFRDVEVAVLRSSWEDPDAIFVGVKGGQNRGGRGHAHLDLGSFVLDAGGTRWALDLGRNNYNVPNYFGRLRFTYYRTKTESHNTVLIDAENQDTVAEAPIFAHRFDPGVAFVQVDLSKTYPRKLKRFERGVALYQDKQVIVQDEIEAKAPVEALWGMVTDATIELRGRRAELRKNGRALTAEIVTPPAARFDSVSTQAPPPEDANPHTRKLVVRLPEKTATLRLAVTLTPHRAGQAAPRLQWKDRRLAEW